MDQPINNVYTQSLSDVFIDSSLKTFTEYALSRGVTLDSIIYIQCNESDSKFGECFIPGSRWIWAKGELFASCSKPIELEKIKQILETE